MIVCSGTQHIVHMYTLVGLVPALLSQRSQSLLHISRVLPNKHWFARTVCCQESQQIADPQPEQTLVFQNCLLGVRANKWRTGTPKTLQRGYQCERTPQVAHAMLHLSLPADLDNMSKPASEQRHCSIDPARIAQHVQQLQQAEAEVGCMEAESAAALEQCAEHIAVLVDMAVVEQAADGTFVFDQAVAMHAVCLLLCTFLVYSSLRPPWRRAAGALVATDTAEVGAC